MKFAELKSIIVLESPSCGGLPITIYDSSTKSAAACTSTPEMQSFEVVGPRRENFGDYCVFQVFVRDGYMYVAVDTTSMDIVNISPTISGCRKFIAETLNMSVSKLTKMSFNHD